MSSTAYPPQLTIEQQQDKFVARQPIAKAGMNAKAPSSTESQQSTQDVMRLRGGCPGHFCGLPILPCHCDICIIPIPCC